MSDAGFARRLLAWHRRHGRHDLPWQRDPSPYRVWVSEIMLQQTRVATVERYFARFVARFPDLPALARAPLDEVLHLWSGLGYYARARNLHRAARAVVAHHGGRLPEDLDTLRTLPGIGRSTAGAILALACGQRHPILDGNAKRVLCRHEAVGGWPGESAVARRLWALAEARTPPAEVAAYTQAIMDLGATLCTRGNPGCGHCPLARTCRARALGRVPDLPAPRPRKPLPEKRGAFLVLCDAAGRVLLERRPPAGIWGGLWSLPEIAPGEDAGGACRRLTGESPRCVDGLAPRRHTFTHFRLHIEPVLVRTDGAPAAALEGPDRVWYNPAAPAPLGLPAPIARLLADLP